MIDFSMDPQEALDQPRFKVELTNHDKVVGNKVLLEQGILDQVGEELKALGYDVQSGVTFEDFGRGQIIQQQIVSNDNNQRRVYWAGSDPRSDGIAIGY